MMQIIMPILQILKKCQLSSIPILLLVLLFGACANNPKGESSASSQKTDNAMLIDETFTCEKNPQGKWVTIANTTRGKIPMILWESTYFNQSGWTPEKRCIEVTEHFRQYEDKGWLNYITICEKN